MKRLRRIIALTRKELQMLLAEPQSRVLVVMPVVLQVLLFPLAVTLEVKNNSLAVLNEDGGAASLELEQRFAQTMAFSQVIHLSGAEQIDEVLDAQQAIAVVRFGQDFTRQLVQGAPVSLQLLLDGRRSNSSQIAASYIQDIAMAYFNEQAALAAVQSSSQLEIRHRYNPNLDYKWFVLPSLVAIILTVSALILTALSVAREREQGTFDQLLVSPLTLEMIMIGKAASVLLVGLFQASIIIGAAMFVYKVPISGSLALIYASAVLYFFALVGVGLFISALCSTQQQAFLGAFSFIMPGILLSGFASPVENMPQWLQAATWCNPIRHYIFIVKSIYLKNISAGIVLESCVPLVVIAMVTLSVAVLIFRRKFG
ncbi:MAG: ABC transporter permease [Desulfovibrionales bacterium]|nr:ABC transporter permease [Desulfovibrionales bacterium]